MIELDPAYVDVIVCRWEKATSGSARAPSGDTFSEVAADRGIDLGTVTPKIGDA